MKHLLFAIVVVIGTVGCAGTPPGTSAGSDEGGGGILVHEVVRSTRSWNGDVLPAYPTGPAEVTILRIVIPAGQTLPWHRHPVINAGVLLRGSLTVETDAGQVLHMKAGDPIVEVVGRWHRGISAGPEDAEIIVFYAGSPGGKLSVLRGEGH